jgi:uncharacterized damage-inducible protein DinB
MTPELATGIRDFLLKTMEVENKTTRRVISCIPDGMGDYAPDNASMKALPLAWHIASSEVFFLDGTATGTFDLSAFAMPAGLATAAEVLAWMEAKRPQASERVQGMTGEQLLAVIDFRGAMQWPAIRFLQLALSHLIHHRGQLSAYLRPMGSKVPSIYGPSGDE